METLKDSDPEQIIRESLGSRDIYGFGLNAEGGWVLDRRYSPEGMTRLGLSPRNADFNLIGPDILEVPGELAEELGLVQ